MAERSVSVGTSVVQVLPFNERRTSVLFHNRGDSECFLSQDKGSVAASGMPILKGGVLVYAKADGDDPRMARYAVCSSGTADLRISESLEPLPLDELSAALKERL